MAQLPVRRRHTAVLAALVVLAALLPTGARASTGGGAVAGPAACRKWMVVASPDEGTRPSTLSGVAAVSKRDVWAVGNSFTGSVYKTLAEHWDGSAWSVVPTANVGTNTNVLTAVAALSTGDVWAVGFYADGTTFRTLAQHWNGSAWSVATTPNMGTGENALESVTAIGPNDVWAVGFRQDAPGSPRVTLAEHWNGTAWSIVPTPNVGTDENFLFSVRARSTGDVWATGSYSVPWFQSLTEHWNGTTWEAVPSPNLGDGSNVLYAAVVVGGSQAVGVGTWLNGNQTATLAQRWNGTEWRVISSPSPAADQNFLYGAAGSSTSDIWAVGWQVDVPFSASRTLGEHWDGNAWTVEKTGNVGSGANVLASVTQIPGSTGFWAVGHYTSGGVDHTLTESHC